MNIPLPNNDRFLKEFNRTAWARRPALLKKLALNSSIFPLIFGYLMILLGLLSFSLGGFLSAGSSFNLAFWVLFYAEANLGRDYEFSKHLETLLKWERDSKRKNAIMNALITKLENNEIKKTNDK